VNAQKPECQPSQRSLRDRDHYASFHRGAEDIREPAEQGGLLIGVKRNSLREPLGQRLAVAQQEE
jgi:intein-encoded DNA endonuclease-like protein